MGRTAWTKELSKPFFLHSKLREKHGAILHEIRRAYGWTDEQILDQVELWGAEWLLETYKFVMEGEQREYKTLAMLAPLHRSPMSKKEADSLKRYSESVHKALDSLTPWKSTMQSRIEAAKARGLKPGEVVVQIDSGDSALNPLFKGAKIAGKG